MCIINTLLESKITKRDNKEQKWIRDLPCTGDSTPAAYIHTPYDGDVSDEEFDDGTNKKVDQEGQMVGENEILDQPLSRKVLRRQKHAHRVQKRFQKILQGKRRNSQKKSKEVDPLIGTSIFRARPARPCSYCHVPYHHKFAPFGNMKLVPCLLCGKKWVPEVILATVEPPERLPVRGPGVFIQAR